MPTALHRIEQARVFAGMAGRGHPVGRQLDALQRLHRRGAQVGDRLADRHARGGGGIEQRQRRALADRHRFAGVAVESGQRDRAIGDRHLPRADHLVARGQAADGAIADGDQEVLGRDGRMREHAQAGFVQVERRGRQFRPARRRRMRGVAMHLRRLAEQHVHRQVDGEVAAGVAQRCRPSRHSRRPGVLPPSRCRPPRTGSARAGTARRTRRRAPARRPST